jgi:hypothetical protein
MEQLPILFPHLYIRYNKPDLKYGRYLVVRRDGKTHLETWNGTGWAYNDVAIEFYYLPKIA